MTDNLFFFMKFKNDVSFVYDNISLQEGLNMMRTHGFTAVPVIDKEGHYKGSLSEGDFLWDILEHGQDPKRLQQESVGSLVRLGFMPAVSISVSFEELLEQSLHQNYVPVVDDRSIFIGIVTRQSILRALTEKEVFKTRKISLSDRLEPIAITKYQQR